MIPEYFVAPNFGKSPIRPRFTGRFEVIKGSQSDTTWCQSVSGERKLKRIKNRGFRPSKWRDRRFAAEPRCPSAGV